MFSYHNYELPINKTIKEHCFIKPLEIIQRITSSLLIIIIITVSFKIVLYVMRAAPEASEANINFPTKQLKLRTRINSITIQKNTEREKTPSHKVSKGLSVYVIKQIFAKLKTSSVSSKTSQNMPSFPLRA